MATILEKANEILVEKDNKILPENLKAGVSFFNVNGTLVELVGETKVVTPTIETQTILPSDGYNGITSVTVNAVDATIDTNIVAENIKEGTTILGVTGNLTSGIDTSDATATQYDIVSGKTAYVNGELVEGKVADITADEGMNHIGADILEYVNGNIDVSEIYTIFRKTNIMNTADTLPVEETRMIIDIETECGLGVKNTALAEAIGLTADKLVSGNTILGIEGTAKTGGIDTSDATAAADNIAYGYTAYVNGEKITGNVPRTTNNSSYEGTNIEIYKAMNPDPSLELEDRLDVRMVISTENRFMEGTTYATCQILYDDLVSLLGITADKIKAGEKVLGITGTYTGEPTE